MRYWPAPYLQTSSWAARADSRGAIDQKFNRCTIAEVAARVKWEIAAAVSPLDSRWSHAVLAVPWLTMPVSATLLAIDEQRSHDRRALTRMVQAQLRSRNKCLAPTEPARTLRGHGSRASPLPQWPTAPPAAPLRPGW